MATDFHSRCTPGHAECSTVCPSLSHFTSLAGPLLREQPTDEILRVTAMTRQWATAINRPTDVVHMRALEKCGFSSLKLILYLFKIRLMRNVDKHE